MARAWVPWRDDDFAGAEREFHASAEFCSETPTWQLHAAHVLFMRGDKYKESAAFYEPVVRQNYDNVRCYRICEDHLIMANSATISRRHFYGPQTSMFHSSIRLSTKLVFI